MNDEGIEWAIRELLLLRKRVEALEAARPAPLTFPAIEPDRVPEARTQLCRFQAPSVEAAERLGMEPFPYSERN